MNYTFNKTYLVYLNLIWQLWEATCRLAPSRPLVVVTLESEASFNEVRHNQPKKTRTFSKSRRHVFHCYVSEKLFVLCNKIAILIPLSSKSRQYNMRKLTELPTALVGAERWQLFLESVCCIPFIEVSHIWGNPHMFWNECQRLPCWSQEPCTSMHNEAIFPKSRFILENWNTFLLQNMSQTCTFWGRDQPGSPIYMHPPFVDKKGLLCRACLYIILINQEWGLRFPCNDRTDEVNRLIIIWPFHYGPEPMINQNQQLACG